MMLWTGGKWVSNVHRVVNPDRSQARTERISIPFFHQPSYHAVITPIGAEEVAGLEPVTSGGWLMDKIQKTMI
jgi:isopenicillin N synthase-like dioxygenase